MNRRHFLAAGLSAALALTLAACQPNTSPAANVAEAPQASLGVIKDRAVGFSVGQRMSARTVYVFFDMQCPHCGVLWESAKPLLDKAHFVWIPVGMLSPLSISQGATILAASDPKAMMDGHEATLRQNGGLVPNDDAQDKFAKKVRENMALLRSFKVGSVPFIVSQDPATGKLIQATGSMDTPALQALLKL